MIKNKNLTRLQNLKKQLECSLTRGGAFNPFDEHVSRRTKMPELQKLNFFYDYELQFQSRDGILIR